MQNKTPITPESIEAFGMTPVKDDPFVIFEKNLTEPTEDLKAMKMVIANYMGQGFMPAIFLPENGTLWLTCDSIHQLETIEKCIAGYEPIW